MQLNNVFRTCVEKGTGLLHRVTPRALLCAAVLAAPLFAAAQGSPPIAGQVFGVSTGNGSITPSVQVVYPPIAGSPKFATLLVTPDTGYEIDAVTIAATPRYDNPFPIPDFVYTCPSTLTAGTAGPSSTTYTTSNRPTLIAHPLYSCTVTASFKLKTYTVTATAGTGGSIGVTPQTVTHGSTATLTATPDTGYTIDTVTGCSGSLSGNEFITAAVEESCDIAATFKKLTFLVVGEVAGGHGTITQPAGPVEYGLPATLELTPEAGYAIDTVASTCGGGLGGNIFSIPSITSDCTVTASFKLVPVVAANVQPVPTLSSYAMMLLVLVMGFFGMQRVRNRH